MLGSPKQLGEVLFERLGLPVDRKGKTGYSTDARVLGKLRELHPIIEVVEQWREQSKLLNTYLEPLPELVDPGRRPAAHLLQPDHRRHRAALVDPAEPPEHPDPDAARARDPQRVHRRVGVHACSRPTTPRSSCGSSPTYPGEPALMDAFARGEDIHRATAAQVLGKPPAELTSEERNRAKAVNFGIIYGISAFGLSEQLGISRDEAQSFIDTYLARFPRGERVHRSATIAQAKEDGYVTTLFGRRRPMPELRASNWQTRVAGRAAGGEHGDAGQRGRHHQGGDDRRAPAPARRGPAVAAGAPDPRRAAVRGRPTARCRRSRRSFARRWCGAYPLDPALDIDIGTGSSWLDAK